MSNVKSVKSHRLNIVVLVVFLTLSIGCAGTKPGPIITPYYQSVLKEETNAANEIPVSIRVNSIAFDVPGKKTNGGAVALKMLPLVSLIPISEETWCNINPEASKRVTREPGEIEKILTEELIKTSLFNEVTFEGAPKDYDIQGKVDFSLDMNSHMSGFGILGVLMPPVLICLPMATYNYKCEAHFEVVSTSDNSIVFSKDYFSKKRFTLGLFYGNILKAKKLFGKKVFPIIVEEFINDLKENLVQKIKS